MRNLLLGYTKDFKVSRPVFYLQLAGNQDIINAQVAVYPNRPIPIEGDPVSRLICDEYVESFNLQQRSYRFNSDEILDRATKTIYAEITKFIENEMPLKNPRQSKLYKWTYLLRNSRDIELQKGILLLYRYMHHSVYDDSFPATERSAHAANIIALLEAMMEKYGEQV